MNLLNVQLTVGLPQAFIHRKHFSSCLFGLAKGINFIPGYRSGYRLSALHFPQEQRFTTILLRRKSKPSDKEKKKEKSAPARSKFVRDSGEITRHDCGGMFPCFFPNIIYYFNYSITVIVQELCESRGGRPELSVLTSLLASVDVKIY